MLIKALIYHLIHVLSSLRALAKSNSLFQGIFSSAFLFMSLYFISVSAIGQTSEDVLSSDAIKKMSMEELMTLEVTSVSKQPEKLTEAASAIQVITQEAIQRSTATNLAEALQLATNLQVAQLNSYAWIISARGFNAAFSNKLLVMIDGRTVYSPLFAGVFWDAQSVVLEDIDRIEVISGPGGTLWGANAVNGVINIITKSAKETQGLYVSGAVGTYLQDFGALRYGGKIGSHLSYRVYSQHHDCNHTFLPEGTDNADQWGFTQTGFRMDWEPSKAKNLMVQGDFYGAKEQTMPSASTLDGQNVLGRWTYAFSDQSELILQVYFDRTWRRDIPSTIRDELETYDFEFQHHFPIRKHHNILWGGGYRLMHDITLNSTPYVGFIPARRDMGLFSAFLQDEITLAPQVFTFTIGSKLQHNVFTGIEIQPSARMSWTPNAQHTVWSAISRAVRMPSRIDVDYYIPTYSVPPSDPNVAGGPNFISESVIAYELGYHIQPTSNVSLSVAAFYNHYDDLYSVEALPGTQTYQIQNGTEGKSWGIELSGTFQITPQWRLRGGYTYFNKNLINIPGHVYDFSDLGNDAQHHALLQSISNLPGKLRLDLTLRYMGKLPDPTIPDYFTFDTRLAWVFKTWGELSIAGQNLGQGKHLEFVNQIPRSIYGKFTCRF